MLRGYWALIFEMGRAAAFRQVDVQRAVRGAIVGAAGTGRNVQVVIEGHRIIITPIDGPPVSSDASEVERRMQEAFGE